MRVDSSRIKVLEPTPSPNGLRELWSTVVVRSRRPAALLAFGSAIGYATPGDAAERPQNVLATNMRVPRQAEWKAVPAVGVEWTIPSVVGREHLGDFPDGATVEPYHVRLTDVIEFARLALVRVHIGGEFPYAEWPAGTKPITWGVEGARQRVRFNDPVVLGRYENFWINVSFPGDAPIFGMTGMGGQEREAALPVTFRFIEAGDAEPALLLSSVSDAIAEARRLQEEATRTMAEINKRLPPHGVDPAVLAELAEMRKDCATDAELADLLRAVRQGIKTR